MHRSGGSRGHVTSGLQNTGLLELFDAIVTCEDTKPGRGKPAPDVFLIAAEKLGVDPGSCVGGTSRSLDAAVQAKPVTAFPVLDAGYEDADLGMQSICSAGFLAAVNVTKLEGYPAFERHDDTL